MLNATSIQNKPGCISVCWQDSYVDRRELVIIKLDISLTNTLEENSGLYMRIFELHAP